MSLEWDRLYKLGTDVAGFVLYHPARLSHQKNSRIDWWYDDSAGEFRDGRLVAFCTGSDGPFTMKFVQRPLTTAERRVLVNQEVFRYEVLDGRLYWDNTNCMPSEYQSENADDDEQGWLELPNGQYRVTVHVMDWFSIPDTEREAEADISHYVIRFESVCSLQEIPVPKKVPWLIANKAWHAELNGIVARIMRFLGIWES